MTSANTINCVVSMLEINKIYCIDALELLKQMPDQSVDLIITDPPYGINIPIESIGGSKNADSTKFVKVEKWDDKIPTEEVFKEIFRVSKNQIIFGGNYFTQYLPSTSSWVIWDKRCNITPQRSYADCELIWTSFKEPARILRFLWDGFIQDEKNKIREKRLHPTQKPVEVIRDLIKKFSKEGDLILDPYSGSGSIALACKQTGRNFIAGDINIAYVEISQKRLSQNVLFPLEVKIEGGMPFPPKVKTLGISGNEL